MTTDNFSKEMKKIKLAGVPEQAFIPIKLAQEVGIFSNLGIEVDFVETPEGTGKLLSLVESGEVDLALTVTDGFIAGKAKGRDVNLCGTYISSPLVWACSVGANSKLDNMGQMASEEAKTGDAKIRWGVSRLGSGSHTMGVYASTNMDVPSQNLDFVVADNFKGLRDGANADKFDAFLWEHFTSKPYWSEDIKHVGDVKTPWPAFSFVEGKNLAEGTNLTHSDISEKLFPGIAEGIKLFVQGNDEIITRICKEHKHTEEDARLWLSRVEYAVSDMAAPMAIDADHYRRSVDIMKDVGLVPKDYPAESLWLQSKTVKFLPDTSSIRRD